MVEIAAKEEEEAQHHGGIEIGVMARIPCLEDGNAGCQHQGQRDREIHAQAAYFHPGPSGAKEGLAGKEDGRNGDGARNPMEKIARHPIGTGPYGDGQEHDVHHGEKRDPKTHQKIAALPVSLGR